MTGLDCDDCGSVSDRVVCVPLCFECPGTTNLMETVDDVEIAALLGLVMKLHAE